MRKRMMNECRRRQPTMIVSVIIIVMMSMIQYNHVGFGQDVNSYDNVISKIDLLVDDSTRIADFEAHLREYIRFPSISAQHDSLHEETLACAEWLRQFIQREVGMENARLFDSGFRNKVVVASSSNDDNDIRPAVVICGHYDVQPIDPEAAWEWPPFEMEKRTLEGFGDVFTGRGSEDDKGNNLAALDVLGKLNEVIEGGLSALPIAVIIVIEGEEEINSPGFKFFLEQNMHIFRNAQLVLSADGNQPYREKGSLLLSLRGLLSVQIDAVGANRDLHSGAYGGSVANPLSALARVLASFHDPSTQRIQIDQFYDDVTEYSLEEKQQLEIVDDVEEARSLGVDAMVGEVGYTTGERRTIRPTLEIVGMYGGYQEAGVKTVLPADAHAKIVFRLAKGQVPDNIYRLLHEHVMKVSTTLAPGVKISLQRLNAGAKPYSSKRSSIGNKIAGDVLDEVYNTSHVTYRSGGSNNMISSFMEFLNLETVELGFGYKDDQVHAPNERWRISDLKLSQKVYARMIMKLAQELSSCH